MADYADLLPAGLPADPALLSALLDLLPMGVIYYTPVLDGSGTLTDLALSYLSPAAQRMTGLPARPATTYRQQFPTTDDNGAWDFHRGSWQSVEPREFQFYYDADGFDSFFRVVARRLGEGLLVVFTDTRDEVRGEVEKALRDSQARERAALARAEAAQREAEGAHADLANVFTQAPAMICIFEGPTHVFQFVNPPYQALVGERPLLGKPIAEAMPELTGQPIFGLLDQVYQTGETFAAAEMLVQLDHHNEGRPELEKRYYNFIYKARHDRQGTIDGILVFAYEVTPQVLARQQIEQLNQELEARVQERTQAAEQAQVLAERQRHSLVKLVEQAPAALCIVAGPDLVYETFNPLYAAMFGGRPRVGRPMGEVLPEVVSHPGYLALKAVYAEGRVIRDRAVLVPLARPDDGTLESRYFDYTQQPRYTSQGEIDGVFVFAVEVTEQVLARQQAEQLNQELEARVQERTRQLVAAQAATEREQAQLQAVLTQAPVAIALFQGEELRFASVNAEMAAILGSVPAPLLGRPLVEAIPELQGQGFDDLLRQVLHTQVPLVTTELPVQLQREGRPALTYYNSVNQALYDADRQVLGVLAVAVEVTQQVLARQQVEQLNQELEARVQERTSQLSEQQALLGRILGQVPAAVATLHGPGHRYSFFNERYQQLAQGRAAHGVPMAEAVPEATGQGFVALLDQVYQTGQPFAGNGLPIELRQADGTLSEHYFDFVFQPLPDAQHQVTDILAFAVEVTGQVQARRQADEAAAELGLLTAHAPAFLFRTDAAGSLVYLNKKFFEWTGLDAARLGSLDEGWATIHPGDLAVQQPDFAAAVQAGEPWQSTPYRFRRRDGQYRWMLTRSQPLLGPEGQVLGYTGLTVEIHEQIELQQQLERTNVDLDNFIYTASHDLKAPITNIEGLLLALEHELPEADRPGDVSLMLTMMQGAIERFRRTINHLTDLSRLQKEHNPDSDAVALAPVVEAVRLDLLPLLAQTHGQLTVSVPDGLTVTFAEKNLRSVVYNLLSNAFKYHHPDREPEVQLRSWVANDYVVLEVQDNGLGLDLAQGQEQRLFGMFQRLHTHVEGTGVGLYMVKRVLENAGGRIEVSSALGAGSTFRVFFRR